MSFHGKRLTWAGLRLICEPQMNYELYSPLTLLTYKDVAQELELAGQTSVRYWVEERKVLRVYAMTPNGMHLFHPDEVERFKQSRYWLERQRPKRIKQIRNGVL